MRLPAFVCRWRMLQHDWPEFSIVSNARFCRRCQKLDYKWKIKR